MRSHDPILFRELPVIQKIIADETWLEGERRGRAVSPDDPVVRENVCLVVLRIGAELREALTRANAEAAAAEMETAEGATIEAIGTPEHHAA